MKKNAHADFQFETTHWAFALPRTPFAHLGARLLPYEVRKLAGHSDIKTTMNYYVGIRESLIDKARDASSAVLGEDFSAPFVRALKKSTNCKKQAVSTMSQAFAKHGAMQNQGNKTLNRDL